MDPLHNGPAELLNRWTGEFVARRSERDFRRHVFVENGSRYAVITELAAFIVAVATLSDLASLGVGALWGWLLALRLVTAGVLVAIAEQLRRRPLVMADGLGLVVIHAGLFVLCAQFLVVCIARPADGMNHIVSSIVMLIGILLFAPTSFRSKVVLAVGFQSSLLVVAGLAFTPPAPSMTVIVADLSITGVMTFLGLAQLNRSERSRWWIIGEQRLVNERLRWEIAESERLRAELHRRATHDALTGLRNRGSFFAEGSSLLAEAIRAGEPVSVVMIDADRFKFVNDTHGHAVGDELLRSIGSAVIEALRQPALTGRLGGEEFGIVLTGADLDAATQVATRVRHSIAASEVRVGAAPVRVTASFGVAQAVAGESLAAALARADRAMYDAKRSGGDSVVRAEVPAPTGELGPASAQPGAAAG